MWGEEVNAHLAALAAKKAGRSGQSCCSTKSQSESKSAAKAKAQPKRKRQQEPGEDEDKEYQDKLRSTKVNATLLTK